MGFVRTFMSRRWRRVRYACLFVVVASFLEVLLHIRSYKVDSPPVPLDEPFADGCKLLDDLGASSSRDTFSAPVGIREPRENATIIMLARNSDLTGALHAIDSLEKQWNQWYHYPIVFLNDKPWDPAFEQAIREVTKSKVSFEQIPNDMWSWPKTSEGDDFPNRAVAQASWDKMTAQGLPYVSSEGYHHMCRFYSGFFYDHPALQPYKYYWRVEPDISFTCKIPYDPFRTMRLRNKIYGWTMALWEIGSTCPSLFRATADFKEQYHVPPTSLWNSFIDASWAPTPIRQLVMSLPSLFHSRDRQGDAWNHCHFWSNFEIADMDFYRSDEYRAYFAELDAAGGFFTERWGDAAVHSLALAMFAKPEQVHYFEDIGYVHPPFQHCPPEGVGCECQCDGEAKTVPSDCRVNLRAGLENHGLRHT